MNSRNLPDSAIAESYLLAAKKLKHEADKETDRTVQARKYLQAVLFFIITGNTKEKASCNKESLESVYCMYRETLRLIRFISDKFAKFQRTPPEEVPTTEFKLAALSYRCQSLLSLKLSRLKKSEISSTNKYIQANLPDHINQPKSPIVTLPYSLFSAMHKQLSVLQQLNYAHDLWQQADNLVEKHPSCAAFFSTLDNECGPLSLNSPIDDLVRYVTTGLKILE